MPYTPILATLAYVFSPNRSRVLMVHRTGRPGDAHAGKFNGLGGKLEPGENILEGIQRELHEEANLTCDELHLAGTISWPGFGSRGEDWFGFLFRVTAWRGEVPAANAEGTLHWVPISEVLERELWPGDRYFLPLIFDPRQPRFHGVMPYAAGQPLDWQVLIQPA